MICAKDYACRQCESKWVSNMTLIDSEVYCRCGVCGKLHVSCCDDKQENSCNEEIKKIQKMEK